MGVFDNINNSLYGCQQAATQGGIGQLPTHTQSNTLSHLSQEGKKMRDKFAEDYYRDNFRFFGGDQQYRFLTEMGERKFDNMMGIEPSWR